MHRPEVGKLFYIEPDSKHYKLCGPDGLWHNYLTLSCSRKAARDNVKTNEHNCDKENDLYDQAASQSQLTVYSFPTYDIDYQSIHLKFPFV